MIGTQLGAYEIKEEIGKGGMATVYRAFQPNVGRDVAIKMITRAAGDEHNIQRFQREARLIARLEHPHILPVYDFDGGHEPPYIVMRYLDGGTLKDVLRQGLLPHDEISFLIRQVASALDYAHRQGIVHRDIKPSNIMVDQEGNAFVTDFGIARMVTLPEKGKQITETGAIVGTPDYMSPEQAMGSDEIDHRTDIYALGVILFQMLTGGLPYTAKLPMGVLVKHMQAAIPSAVSRNPELPLAVDGVLERALAKSPDDRFDSTVTFAENLTAALGGTITNSPLRLRQAAQDSMILRRAQPDGDTGSQTPSEQNKIVTVLYATAVEYAEIVDETAGREAARAAMKDLWEASREIIEEYGGQIISLTDDTMLALWGITSSREDDAERAVRAGLAMQEMIAAIGTKYLEGEDETLPLNIGINTGLALLTPSEASGSITASGASISLTNRLAQQAAGEVLITHSTYTQVRGIFDVEPENPLRMRRSHESIPVYRIGGAKPRAFRLSTRGVEGIETGMIGRDAEFRQLQNAYLDMLEDAETQVVTVLADAGLGKSRLLYEFINWSDLRPEKFWIFRGRATPEMTRRPYALFRDLISFRFDIRDSDSPETVRGKLEKGVASQIGRDEETAHLLGYLAGFDLSESPHVKGLLSDPQQLTNRARQLFHRWVVKLCDISPVVIEVEDIHHADNASLDLLTGFISEYADLPVLLIVLARPALLERRPNWGSGLPYHIRIELRPLDKRQSRSLVREILQKIAHVPKNLRDLLVDRAEGNPYYLEELVKMLIDDRVIIKDSDDEWRVEEARLDHLEVPATLIGLLQARLDSLLYPERLTLQRAAVIGRVFYDDALQALDDADETHIQETHQILQRLSEREFIQPRETTAFEGSAEYIFGGNMLREVLLNTLVRRQRRTYNQAAAAWLIQASAGRVDEYNGLIADFYEKAGEMEEAAVYLLRAGERALAISAFGEARETFQRIRTLLSAASSAWLSASLLLGEVSYLLGDYADARAKLQEALDIAFKLDDKPRAAESLYWLSQVESAAGDYAQAKTLLEESEPLARHGKDPASLARVLYGLGDQLWRQGDLKQALRYVQESLDLARKSGDTTQELYARNRIGVITWQTEGLAKARKILEDALEMARRVGNRERAASILNNLGVLTVDAGDYTAAQTYTEQALLTVQEIGNQQSVAVYLNNLAEGAIHLGDVPLAKSYLHRTLALSLRLGLTPSVIVAAQVAGWLFARAGDRARGLPLIGFSFYHASAESDSRRNASEKLANLGLSQADVDAELRQCAALQLETVARELLAEFGEGD
jgi:class 3 adenylate cyclase/tetratricopeptide (TPR) repeat protein